MPLGKARHASLVGLGGRGGLPETTPRPSESIGRCPSKLTTSPSTPATSCHPPTSHRPSHRRPSHRPGEKSTFGSITATLDQRGCNFRMQGPAVGTARRNITQRGHPTMAGAEELHDMADRHNQVRFPAPPGPDRQSPRRLPRPRDGRLVVGIRHDKSHLSCQLATTSGTGCALRTADGGTAGRWWARRGAARGQGGGVVWRRCSRSVAARRRGALSSASVSGV